jgi:hypothetical protein
MEDEIVGACSILDDVRNIKICLHHLEGRDHLEDQSLDGRIILKLFLNKLVEKV